MESAPIADDALALIDKMFISPLLGNHSGDKNTWVDSPYHRQNNSFLIPQDGSRVGN